MKSDSKIENIAIEFNSADFAFDQSRGTKCLRKLKALQTIWVYVQLPNWCLHSVGLYRVTLIAFITHNLIFFLPWRRYLAFLTHTRVPTSHIPRMLGYTRLVWALVRGPVGPTMHPPGIFFFMGANFFDSDFVRSTVKYFQTWNFQVRQKQSNTSHVHLTFEKWIGNLPLA